MRTVSYRIRHWVEDDCFEIMETETLHTVLGDRTSEHGIAAFGTKSEAEEFLRMMMRESFQQWAP